MFPLTCNKFTIFPSSANGSIFDFLSITAKTFFADPRADAKISINGGSLEMFSADVTRFKNTFTRKRNRLMCFECVVTKNPSHNQTLENTINHTVISTGMVYVLVSLSLSASTH